MSVYTERTQVLLTPEQKARIERVAQRDGVSVGAVLRAAVDAHLAPRSRPREDALASLFALDAPVDDWETMKSEIEDGATR